MNTKNIIITIITVVAVGLGSFYSGTIYQKQKNSSNYSHNENSGNFQRKSDGQESITPRMRQNNSGGAFENGEIISKDDKSITIKTKDGSSKIVYFSNSTTVGKTVDGSVTDLNVGNQVMINGKNDSSGIITAQNIQIRPEQKNL